MRGAAGGFTPGPLVCGTHGAGAPCVPQPAFPERTSAPRPAHATSGFPGRRLGMIFGKRKSRTSALLPVFA